MAMTDELVALVSLMIMGAMVSFPVIYIIVHVCAVRRALFGTFLLEHVLALIRLGLPLRKGLEPCGRRAVWGSESDLQEVAKGLDAGELLGEALARVPAVGESAAATLVRVACWAQARPVPRLVSAAEAEVLRLGERSGDLRGAIELVLRQRRRTQDMRRLLMNTLLYPFVLCVAIAILLSSIGAFIVPKMARMYAELDLELPAITRVVFDLPLEFALLWVVLAFSLLYGLIRAAKRARHLSQGHRFIADLVQRIVYHLPLVRGPTKRLFLVEFCRELAMLMRLGTPADRGLAVIADGTVHPVFRDKLNRAVGCVQQGMPLADALAEAHFDAPVVLTVRMAESSGDLPAALLSLSDEFAVRSQWAANLFARLAPPLLILVLGLVVAAMACGIFLPLINLMYKLM